MTAHRQFSREPDQIVGARIRHRREQLGLSAPALGQKIGLTPQCVYQFEWGKTRIVTGHFVNLAKALRVPVAYFFQDLDVK